MRPIATECTLYRSPDPQGIFCYTPFLARGFGGRLLASFDLGGKGVGKLPGPKSDYGDFRLGNQTKIFLSDDHGKSWRPAADIGMLHARIFRAGRRLYLLGHSGRMLISSSEDNGEHWSEPTVLEGSRHWHQSGCTIDVHNDRIYLVMEAALERRTWPDVSLVLMAADRESDLTRPESWRFSPEWRFDREVTLPQSFGMPFYPTGDQCPGVADPRYCGEPGNLETNVLRIYDPRHHFYDPEERTVVLLSRLHSGTTNLATMLRGRERSDGALEIDTFTTPGGAPFLFLPFPGGQMKFQIVYDEVSRLYWLIATQSTDSMTRPELLDEQRVNLPNNERRRLVLYFSRNLVDWSFAGLVASGQDEKASRHYASLLIDGEDLLVLSRSGDSEASSAHNGNLVTLHRIPDFRKLSR